jgi:lipoprotein-releasing system permease protein
VVSIAVAIVSLVSAFAILGGFEDTIKQKIYSFSGHLVVSKYTLSTSFEESSIDVSDSVLNHISGLQGIDHIQTYAYKAGLLKANDEVQGVIMKGVGASFDTVSFSNHMIAGRFPIFPIDGYGLEVAISKKMANYLRLQVGDDMTIFFIQNPPRFRKLKLVGIYETGLEDFDEKTLIGDINLLRRINGWDENQAGGIEVFLKEVNNLDQAEEDLFDNTGHDLYVDKVSDKYAQIFDWLRLLHRNVVIFLGLILFVACFNMVSILLILIMERTQMIGTLKALGANNSQLRKVFLYSGLRLIVNGLLWGNIIALGLCWIQHFFKLIPLDPANYYMTHVPITFNWPTIFFINIAAIALIGITLLIPLAFISRINPIRSIRFD